MKTSLFQTSGYTLVEIMISVALSLFLLLGVVELFRGVGTTVTDTQATLNMTANLNNVSILLRNDLKGIISDLAKKPKKMVDGDVVSDSDGYLEIIDGMGAPSQVIASSHTRTLSTANSRVFSTAHAVGNRLSSDWVAYTENGLDKIDNTVGDVDDIIAFTARCNPKFPFRGLRNGYVTDSERAEIIWFVRGKTLYRRVLLIDTLKTISGANSANFYRNNDFSVRLDPANTNRVIANTLSDLALRENRFAHSPLSATGAATPVVPFPYPMYYSGTNLESWYILRMPTLEETASSTWPIGRHLPEWLPMADLKYSGAATVPTWSTGFWDFWENPNAWPGQDSKTGSLTTYSGNRTAEDVILTNVISFDVKVWNPVWVPCTTKATGQGDGDTTIWAPPQYVDLGQETITASDGTRYYVNYARTSAPTAGAIPSGATWGLGFCSKGKYAGTELIPNNVNYTVSGSPPPPYTVSVSGAAWTDSTMSCVFDSWSRYYEDNVALYRTSTNNPVTTDWPVAGTDRVGIGVDPNITATPRQFECPPPYDTELKGIEVTIRCYDPGSGNIRQVRIVHSF